MSPPWAQQGPVPLVQEPVPRCGPQRPRGHRVPHVCRAASHAVAPGDRLRKAGARRDTGCRRRGGKARRKAQRLGKSPSRGRGRRRAADTGNVAGRDSQAGREAARDAAIAPGNPVPVSPKLPESFRCVRHAAGSHTDEESRAAEDGEEQETAPLSPCRLRDRHPTNGGGGRRQAPPGRKRRVCSSGKRSVHTGVQAHRRLWEGAGVSTGEFRRVTPRPPQRAPGARQGVQTRSLARLPPTPSRGPLAFGTRFLLTR